MADKSILTDLSPADLLHASALVEAEIRARYGPGSPISAISEHVVAMALAGCRMPGNNAAYDVEAPAPYGRVQVKARTGRGSVAVTFKSFDFDILVAVVFSKESRSITGAWLAPIEVVRPLVREQKGWDFWVNVADLAADPGATDVTRLLSAVLS